MCTIWLWGRGYDEGVWGRSKFGQQEWGWLIRSNCYLVKRLQNEQTLYGHGCCRLSCNYGGGWLMRLDCCWVKASKWTNPMVIGITYWAAFLLSFSAYPCDIPFLNAEIWHTLNFATWGPPNRCPLPHGLRGRLCFIRYLHVYKRKIRSSFYVHLNYFCILPPIMSVHLNLL
jgi:hypothetical protein